MIAVEPVWRAETALGEGPAWFADERLLRFVDIKAGKLLCFDPATRHQETLYLGGQPSFVLPGANGTVIVGSGDGVFLVEGGGLSVRIASIDQPDHNRFNDATIDARGRLWCGTMDDNETQRTGALYCIDRGVVSRVGGEAVVTNGPAVTADCQTLYHVDSAARTIWKFSLNDGAEIVERSVFLQLGTTDGYPDGVVLDSEGCLWVALWDGWGLRRYSPEGRQMLHVQFPCARGTKLAFGGPDLRTAYVTTARTGLDAAALGAQPLAGALFAFDANVAGNSLPVAQF